MEIVFSQKTINVFQIPNAVINVIQGETWAHLWYLYCLLGIYITFPIWNMISKNASEREFKYILIILFIFASIIKTLNTMGFNIGFYNHISNIYPFWFLCGAGYHRAVGWLTVSDSVFRIDFFSLSQPECYSGFYDVTKDISVWLDGLKENSFIWKNIGVSEKDKFISLSTCTGAEGTSRTVLTGKLTEV